MTPLDHVVHVGQVLDSLGIRWVLGGSLASSLVGEPRSTMDIDIAVVLDLAAVDALVAAVETEYYVSDDAARDAVLRHSSFNLIHYASGMKVDLFPLGDDLLDVRQIERRERVEISPGVPVWVGTPEDQVLRKLHWFRLGGEVSERQWRDVVAILSVQGTRIDHHELVADAVALGLADLVTRAVADASQSGA